MSAKDISLKWQIFLLAVVGVGALAGVFLSLVGAIH